jgi:hypothetical protein
MLKQTAKLNEYEIELLKTLEVEYDGFVYKGQDLLVQMVLGIAQGNYTLYNLTTGGIGKMNPVGNLLTKLGIE